MLIIQTNFNKISHYDNIIVMLINCESCIDIGVIGNVFFFIFLKIKNIPI